jgi:hypothetical protein
MEVWKLIIKKEMSEGGGECPRANAFLASSTRFLQFVVNFDWLTFYKAVTAQNTLS